MTGCRWTMCESDTWMPQCVLYRQCRFVTHLSGAAFIFPWQQQGTRLIALYRWSGVTGDFRVLHVINIATTIAVITVVAI